MRLLCGLLVLLSLLLATRAQSCSQTVYSSHVDCTNFALHRGRLKLDGIQLVDQFGETVQLRGLSSHGLQYFPDCVTKDSIAHHVTTWGINVFRAVVYIDAVDYGYEVNSVWLDRFIVKIVQWCKELGIYVIIDWHVLASGDPNKHLDYQGADTGLAVDFWTKYATLYKDETHVLFEIANEPNNVAWSTVLDYHNSIISAIRAIDPEVIIIAGTSKWCQEIDLAYNYPVAEPYNVMYSFHFYAATHSNLLPLFEQYMHLMPLFVSEWRISDASGTGAYNTAVAEQYLNKFAGLDDISPPTTVVSWVQWSLADRVDTASILVPGTCTTKTWDATTCQGKYTENYFKAREYMNEQLDCDRAPTASPSVSARPTSVPSGEPSGRPSRLPTSRPSGHPTGQPSPAPSVSLAPTAATASRSSVDVEDVIGPSGAYLISFLLLCGIGLAAFVVHEKYTKHESTEGNFKLASTTFEAVKPTRSEDNPGRLGSTSNDVDVEKCDGGYDDGGHNNGEYFDGGEVELGTCGPQEMSLIPSHDKNDEDDGVTSQHYLPRCVDDDNDDIDLTNIYTSHEEGDSYYDVPQEDPSLLLQARSSSLGPPSPQRQPSFSPPSPQKQPSFSSHASPHDHAPPPPPPPPAQETTHVPQQKRKSPPPQTRTTSGRVITTAPALLAMGQPPSYKIEPQQSFRSRFEKKKPTRNTRTIKKN